MLERYAERFDCLGKQFIEKLKKYDENTELELFHLVGLYALDVVCGMFFLKRPKFMQLLRKKMFMECFFFLHRNGDGCQYGCNVEARFRLYPSGH